MQEIEQLKEEEKLSMWDDGDSAETVEYLKVTEDEVRSSAPSTPRRRTRSVQQPARSWRSSRLLRLAAIGIGVWLTATVVSSGLLIGNWWALFLLFPIIKNVQSIDEDRRNGTVTRQTKRALNGAVFGTLFTIMFLTNAWNIIYPGLLIAWGISYVLYNHWRNEPAII